jgi:rhodanese-related sulfurtransferase
LGVKVIKYIYGNLVKEELEMESKLKEDRFDITRDNERARKFFEDMLGYTVSAPTFNKQNNNKTFRLYDARSTKAFEKEHIKNAISTPVEDIEDNLEQFSRELINVVYTYNNHCQRAAKAAFFLANNNYPVMILDGGIDTWKKYYYEIVSKG